MINSCAEKGSVKDLTHFYNEINESSLLHLQQKWINE